jgi:hypothetical protein
MIILLRQVTSLKPSRGLSPALSGAEAELARRAGVPMPTLNQHQALLIDLGRIS